MTLSVSFLNAGLADYLDDGLVYADEIPIGWRILEETPSVARMMALNEENERLLRYIASLDAYHHETTEDDALAHGIARLESKINMLMDMVSQVLVSKLDLPLRSRLYLSAKGVVWSTDMAAPEIGQQVEASLYLNQQLPHPFTVVGHVAVVDSGDQGTLVAMPYSDMSDIVLDHLERLVFRQHRRMVAQRHSAT